MDKIRSKRIEELDAKINQLKARKAAEEARLRKKLKKDDTRRKILVGAYFLDQAERNGTTDELFKKLDGFLIRNADRELFGLPVKSD
jgi:hypothetical protein